MWTPADVLKGSLFAVAVLVNGAILVKESKGLDPRSAATQTQAVGTMMANAGQASAAGQRSDAGKAASFFMRLVDCRDALPPPRTDT